MTVSEPFIDYYDILQVDWQCDARTLEYAYRQLAKQYHPDHPESADVMKFNEVIVAYRALRNPDDRANYDIIYRASTKKNGSKFVLGSEADIEEEAALSDAEAHQIVLSILYKRRRECAQDAGVAQFSIQEALNCSDEVFDFHVWYLRAKGLVERTEQGTLAITIDGVDHVISSSRTKQAEKLRIAQSSNSRE
jgi:curved DNA-binding protein